MKLFKKIANLIMHLRVQCKIKEAAKQAKLTGRKMLVIMAAGKPVVISKQRLVGMYNRHCFKKGVTIEQIEKNALFISK